MCRCDRGLGEIWHLDLMGPYVVFAYRFGRPHPIHELKSGDFSGLTALKQLDIGHNKLTSLSPDIFSGLSSLAEIEREGDCPLLTAPDAVSVSPCRRKIHID